MPNSVFKELHCDAFPHTLRLHTNNFQWMQFICFVCACSPRCCQRCLWRFVRSSHVPSSSFPSLPESHVALLRMYVHHPACACASQSRSKHRAGDADFAFSRVHSSPLHHPLLPPSSSRMPHHVGECTAMYLSFAHIGHNFYCFCDTSVREKAWRSRKRVA